MLAFHFFQTASAIHGDFAEHLIAAVHRRTRDNRFTVTKAHYGAVAPYQRHILVAAGPNHSLHRGITGRDGWIESNRLAHFQRSFRQAHLDARHVHVYRVHHLAVGAVVESRSKLVAKTVQRTDDDRLVLAVAHLGQANLLAPRNIIQVAAAGLVFGRSAFGIDIHRVSRSRLGVFPRQHSVSRKGDVGRCGKAVRGFPVHGGRQRFVGENRSLQTRYQAFGAVLVGVVENGPWRVIGRSLAVGAHLSRLLRHRHPVRVVVVSRIEMYLLTVRQHLCEMFGHVAPPVGQFVVVLTR